MPWNGRLRDGPVLVAKLRPTSVPEAARMILGLAWANYWLRERGVVPPLNRTKVYWKAQPPGHEDWFNARQVWRQGHGDCDNLVAWRLADLWLNYVRSGRARDVFDAMRMAYPGVVRTGPRMLHAIIKFEDGRREDISKLRGMGRRRRAEKKRAQKKKAARRRNRRITV